jgi:hypothetical protein
VLCVTPGRDVGAGEKMRSMFRVHDPQAPALSPPISIFEINAFPTLKSNLEAVWREALQELIQQKHLYQHVEVNVQPAIDASLAKLPQRAGYDFYARLFASLPLASGERAESVRLEANHTFTAPELIPGNARIYCNTCKASEAFRPVFLRDVLNHIAEAELKQELAESPRNRLQHFAITYLCQRCKISQTVFLIKADAKGLKIVGRAPIEGVEAPALIPPDSKGYYREALLAFQTGRTLAAIFFLRVLVEQYLKSVVPPKAGDKVSDIANAYAATIPENIRSHMPSLASIYSRLSVAIHAAEADANIFEGCRNEVLEHFDFRRLYKLDSTTS